MEEPCKTPKLQLLPLFFFMILCSKTSLSADLALEDKASLLLFRSLVQDPKQRLSTWFGSDCANWTGIVCHDQTGRVLSINLRNMSLSGQIHSNICKVSFLKYLILSQNYFTCPIPVCFGAFRRLKTLDFGYNRFHGVLPRSLMRLRHLKELVVNGNKDLGGLVPWWIGNFSSKLEKIDLGFNSFRGEIPMSLFYLKSLKYFDIGNNHLSGNLHEFEQSLVFLNLASNQLSGTLPCFLDSVQSLTVLNLANNSIVGGIPTCIASLQALTHLNLSFNQLNYEISPRFVFSENLLVLDLSNNDLSGPLPRKITTIDKSSLVLLDLSHNQFSGEIPLKITELKSLQALLLSHNLLNGAIPARIGNLTYLQAIDLSHNSLSGSIPLNIVGCFQLLALILNNNNLSGEIQPELDALDSLKILDISNNMISGEIPLTLAGCKSLEVVDFSSNNLSGTLNDAITKWLNLKFLSVARNSFTGNLPSWLLTFEGIQMMDLSGNKFSGFIPDGNFNISLNFNKGNIFRSMSNKALVEKEDVKRKVFLIVVDKNTELSFNYDISSQVGIDLSGNMLHGKIPDGLFGLQGLEYINLSHNFLVGPVPGFEKMSSLRVLDLSYNSLWGQIPGNISSLHNLAHLNLSYNHFSGFVTKKQGYWRFPGAFAGNPDLCLESSSNEGCNTARLPVAQGRTIEDETAGPLIIWVFVLSTFVSFYIGIVILFCHARARNYILQTKF